MGVEIIPHKSDDGTVDFGVDRVFWIDERDRRHDVGICGRWAGAGMCFSERLPEVAENEIKLALAERDAAINGSDNDEAVIQNYDRPIAKPAAPKPKRKTRRKK